MLQPEMRCATALVWLLLGGPLAAAQMVINVESDGRPVAGAVVTAWPLSVTQGALTGGTVNRGRTNAQGQVVLDDLDPGPYELQCLEPLGAEVRQNVAFPASGPLRGVIRVPADRRPDSLRLELDRDLIPADEAARLTLRVTDRAGRPAPDGTKVKLTCAAPARLRAGRAQGQSITVISQAGRAEAWLHRAAPGRTEVEAAVGDVEARIEVVFHGSVARLILDLGGIGREPYPYPHTPPGQDIPMRVTARDRHGNPVAGAPFELSYQPMPGGVVSHHRGQTGPTGAAVVHGTTSAERIRYRAIARHGALQTSTDYLTMRPAGYWVETSLTWDGAVGLLRMRCHQPPTVEPELVVEVQPAKSLVVLDEYDTETTLFIPDADGTAVARLVRVAPGPVQIRVECPGALPAWIAAGSDRVVLPLPPPVSFAVTLPEPGYAPQEAVEEVVLPLGPWHRSLPGAGLVARPAVVPAMGLAPELPAYTIDGLPGRRLLGRAGDRLIGPARALSQPAGVALPLAEKDSAGFTVLSHRFAAGGTSSRYVEPKPLAARFGVEQVFDFSEDLALFVHSVRPAPGSVDPPSLWVTSRRGDAWLVATDWRQIDRASLAGQAVLVTGLDLSGNRRTVRYEPVRGAAPGR